MSFSKLIERVYIALRLEEDEVQEMGCTLSRRMQEALDAMRQADDGSLDLAYLLRVTEPEPPPPPPPKPRVPLRDNVFKIGHRVYSRKTVNLGTDTDLITIRAMETNGTVMRVPCEIGESYWVRWHKRTMQPECNMEEVELILAPADVQPAHLR